MYFICRPAYWYFDWDCNSCPVLPEDHHFSNATIISGQKCRVYFNLCKSQAYQCSGAVCLRYLDTEDSVSRLGKYESGFHPFKEGTSFLPLFHTITIFIVNI